MPIADRRRAERDLDHCFGLLARGSRSFHAASLLLPRGVRRDIAPIYGFCRVADDAVDGPDGSLQSVARLRRRLDLVYAGTPTADPVDRALTHVVARHAIPRAPLDALLEGFEWEFDGRPLEIPALPE